MKPRPNTLGVSVKDTPAQCNKETAIAENNFSSAMAVVLSFCGMTIALFYFVSIKLHYSREFVFKNQPVPRSDYPDWQVRQF